MYILLDGEDRKQDTVFSGYTYSSSYWSKYLQEGLLGKSQINRKSESSILMSAWIRAKRHRFDVHHEGRGFL